MFHGWRIVLAGFVIQMFGSALANHSAGTFIVVLQGELGWSKALISGAFAAAVAQAALLAPFQARLVHAIGPRAVVRVGVLFLAAGLAAMGWVRTEASLYVAVLLIGLGYTLTFDVALQTTIVNWFDRRRGAALGVMMSGFGAGGALVPAVAWAMTELGWRRAALLGAAVMAAVGLAAAQVISWSPEDRGEVPDGARGDILGKSPAAPEGTGADGLSAKEAFRTRSFWLLAGGQALSMFGATSVAIHLVPYAVEQLPLSLEAAGGLMTLLLACAVAGNVGGGILADRLDKRTALVVLTLIQAAGLGLVVFGRALSTAILFCVTYGLTLGARGPLALSIRADYFGRKAYATLWGVSLLFANIGSMAGMVATAYLADRFGGYQVPFATVAALTLLAALLFAKAGRPDAGPGAAQS